MLPGYLSGYYTHDDVHIDLARLARFAGARFVHAEAAGLDLQVCVCAGAGGGGQGEGGEEEGNGQGALVRQCHPPDQLHPASPLCSPRLSPQAQRVLLRGGRPPLRYDLLSLNLGITPALSRVPGAAQHTTPVKPISG